MSVNVGNINRLIEVLKKDSGIHFRMAVYIEYTPESDAGKTCKDRFSPAEYLECQTAMCLAGWANALSMLDAGIDYKNLKEADADDFIDHFGDESRANAWLGISYGDGRELFYLKTAKGPSKTDFDLVSPEKRKLAGIRVLEILRGTGEVNWDQAIVDAGIVRKEDGWE